MRLRSIKTMLLGIAFLIIASIGNTYWGAGSAFGAVIFFLFLILGLFFCIDGFLTPDNKDDK